MKLRITLSAAILFSFLFICSVQAQEKTCVQCGKQISGKYLIVEGKNYHPEHFLCGKCGKSINGNYTKEGSKFYHPDCYTVHGELICAECGKELDGEYYVSGGKKYHKECYTNSVLPKCAVCLEPLSGTYTIDAYGNKYHSFHNKELNKCSCCDRLISKNTTGGGNSLSDGRYICNICGATSVYSQREIERTFDLTAQRLISMGLKIDLSRISVKGVDINGMKQHADNYTAGMQGYCSSETEKEYVNGKLNRTTTTHVIYVLNGLPSILLESVIAHELMHAWLYDNTHNKHSSKIAEGSCNYISYLYLVENKVKQSNDFLRKLENNPDPVYGGGFREIRNRFSGRPIRELLEFLKNG